LYYDLCNSPINYKNNLETQKNIINYISNMFDKKKDDALEVSKTILNDDLSTIGY
jgi:hypothetical protein